MVLENRELVDFFPVLNRLANGALERLFLSLGCAVLVGLCREQIQGVVNRDKIEVETGHHRRLLI